MTEIRIPAPLDVFQTFRAQVSQLAVVGPDEHVECVVVSNFPSNSRLAEVR